jgi:surface antigen
MPEHLPKQPSAAFAPRAPPMMCDHFFMSRQPSLLKILGFWLAFVAAISLATSAFATPPPWAPAHGWRRKHDPQYPGYVGYTGQRWPRDYGVIHGNCDRAAIGAVLGGVVGGAAGAAIGSQTGSNSGRTVAIVVGTVLGAVVGHEIGRNMDEEDRACTGHALELAGEGQSVRWLNDTTGVSYVVTPIGRVDVSCRNFKLQASRGGESHTTTSRACRAHDGSWQVAEAH